MGFENKRKIILFRLWTFSHKNLEKMGVIKK